jgi:non-ribosomal peptide synthetase component F
VLEEHLQYWRKQLEGAPSMLELPADRPRPTALSFSGAVERMELEDELSEKLKALSRHEGVTLFMLLLAGFQLLLSKYSGQQDVVVGTAVGNRNRGETEGMIGFFVNILALRTELTGNPTFRELLRRVREVCLGAYAHQDLPFEKLVEVLNPDRAISNTPLFQAQFVLQNAPTQKLRLPGLELSSLDGFNASPTAKLDLLLTITEGKQGMGCVMEYSTELFDSNTIARMLRHFKKLLGSIVVQPDARIDTLEYLTEDERQQWSARKKKREESAIRKFNSQKLKPISLSEVEMTD